MATVGKTFTIYYEARGRQSGLSDVRMVVFRPDHAKIGVYTLTEAGSGDGNGVYYYDFIDSDFPGSYLFVIDCPSAPLRSIRQEYFYTDNPFSKTDRDQLMDSIDFIKQVESGKWQIVGNQMIFYRDDNTTELMRFNLFDRFDNPSNENVYRRERE